MEVGCLQATRSFHCSQAAPLWLVNPGKGPMGKRREADTHHPDISIEKRVLREGQMLMTRPLEIEFLTC